MWAPIACIVVHAYNPSIQEVEAGGPQVWDQPGVWDCIKTKISSLREGIWWFLIPVPNIVSHIYLACKNFNEPNWLKGLKWSL
jgi:hypothetical protein